MRLAVLYLLQEIQKSFDWYVPIIGLKSGVLVSFTQHYETTQSFIRSLELLAPSRQAVEDMRNHPVYASFERRWQLPVYFQLRWKEIIGAMEDTLSLSRL